MKIVVAFDKFKGSLDARTACAEVERVLKDRDPALQIVTVPMADGGEGTADAMVASLGGEWIDVSATGPLPSLTVGAGFVWFPRQRRCLVEMARASGLQLLRPGQRNPLLTTTFGTGELLAAAFARERPVWLAVGGSATVDGGVGAAMAMGWTFLDAQGKPMGHGGGELRLIRSVAPPAERRHPAVEVLCDVTNPLVGESGAARMFAPQKGATPEMVSVLEAGLRNLAEVVKRDLGKDIASLPGGGAAGGLAAGASAFFDARLVSGVNAVMEACGLDEMLNGADWVITGEGRFDETSLRGKVVSGVATSARAAGVKVAVLAGCVDVSEAQLRELGVDAAIALQAPGMDADFSIRHARDLLAARAAEWHATYLK